MTTHNPNKRDIHAGNKNILALQPEKECFTNQNQPRGAKLIRSSNICTTTLCCLLLTPPKKQLPYRVDPKLDVCSV